MGDARLEQWLDALDRCRGGPATQPPGAFIAAVRRRRRNRRVGYVAQACAGATAVVLFIAMLFGGRPIHPAGLTRHPDPSAPPRTQAAAAIPETSMIALTRANRALDADHVVLPDPAASTPPSPAARPRNIPLSGIWTADQVERWLGGN